MARVEIFPDGALILIIGKGSGLVMMIYVVAIMMDFSDPEEMTALSQVPVYEDKDGKQYFSDNGSIYYLDEDGDPVIVDGTELLGILNLCFPTPLSEVKKYLSECLCLKVGFLAKRPKSFPSELKTTSTLTAILAKSFLITKRIYARK